MYLYVKVFFSKKYFEALLAKNSYSSITNFNFKPLNVSAIPSTEVSLCNEILTKPSLQPGLAQLDFGLNPQTVLLYESIWLRLDAIELRLGESGHCSYSP